MSGLYCSPTGYLNLSLADGKCCQQREGNYFLLFLLDLEALLAVRVFHYINKFRKGGLMVWDNAHFVYNITMLGHLTYTTFLRSRTEENYDTYLLMTKLFGT